MKEIYGRLATPPADAIKKIDGGKLKGMSDINPQWRYEALTNEFGACGYGWKVEIVNTFTEAVPATQELMIFVQVNLYIKDGDAWSEPIPGFGGDFLIVKDKNGIHGNDEGYKMAVTDAIGTAAKMIGVAADVYRGRMDSKYSNRGAAAYQQPKKAPTKDEHLKAVAAEAKKQHLSGEDVKEVMRRKYGKSASGELTDAEAADLAANFIQYAVEFIDEQAKMMEGI